MAKELTKAYSMLATEQALREPSRIQEEPVVGEAEKVHGHIQAGVALILCLLKPKEGTILLREEDRRLGGRPKEALARNPVLVRVLKRLGRGDEADPAGRMRRGSLRGGILGTV